MTSPEHERAATILVVEDRPEVLEVVRRTLVSNRYTVVTAADGEEGLQKALDLQPDLVILDVGLPRRDGIDVAKQLRHRAFRAPLLMLTALDTVSDKVLGLDAGADDYLPKPFDYLELLARVKALLRRATLRDDEVTMRVGDLTLDSLSRKVARGGRPISLTAKEYALLDYLMRNVDRPVSRDQISEQVWKQPFDPASNIVDVYVSYLRQKIDDPALGPPLVHTVRGTGYVLRG
jgi:two-component system copper resistance phosphate regulon response regulator CusR